MFSTHLLKQIKKIKNMAFNKLPYSVRVAAIRKYNPFHTSYIYSDFKLEYLTEYEDLIEAHKLMYKGFTEVAFAKPNNGEIYFSPYHFVETAKVLGIKINGRIIATVTIYADSKHGLPCEKNWSIEKYKSKGKVFEIGSLVVDKEYRHLTVEIFLKLGFFMYSFGVNQNSPYTMLIRSNKRHVDYYEALFGYKIAFKNPVNDKLANNAKLFLSAFEWPKAESVIKNIYINSSVGRVSVLPQLKEFHKNCGNETVGKLTIDEIVRLKLLEQYLGSSPVLSVDTLSMLKDVLPNQRVQRDCLRYKKAG